MDSLHYNFHRSYLFSRLSPKPPPRRAPPRPPRLPPPPPRGLPGLRLAVTRPFSAPGNEVAMGRLLLPMETRSFELHWKLQSALAGEGGATLMNDDEIYPNKLNTSNLKYGDISPSGDPRTLIGAVSPTRI